MVKGKGVYETIDTFLLMKENYPTLRLTMVGDGPELDNLKEYSQKKNIKDVYFTGALSSEDRLNAFRDADFFILPTTYGEGLPTVVLEAMAFGMPVLTRTVGGLVDYFEDGKMGRITNSLSPSEYAEMIDPYIRNKDLTKRTSIYNHKYAVDHFMASKVGRKLETLIKIYTKAQK